MATLTLRVADYRDARHWRWVLEDAQGGFLADHEAALDEGAPEYEGFVELHDYLRWRRDPQRVVDSERELVAAVGEWIGRAVLGPVGPAIVQASPITVRVVLPAAAATLLYRPIELAHVGGRPLTLQDVSLVFELEGESAGGRKEALPDRVRMLAVFSLPTDTSALALRHERHALRRLIRRVAQAHGRAIELRVLQYGVTKELLRDVLMDGMGWDLLHFSGHGLPAGLVLESSDGRSDVVSSKELVQLLRAGRSRLKLVSLSSCDSAAADAVDTLNWLGLEVPAVLPHAPGAGEALPSVARELWRELDCAILAMRYPVGDAFAVELAGSVYDALLGKGQPLSRALQLAMQKVLGAGPRPGVPALSIATPALFGPRAAELMLEPPPSRPAGFEVGRMAYFPPEPERFVGRVEALVRSNATLAPDGEQRGVFFYGMAGAGKTACALELAYRYEDLPRFQYMVWHKAPDEGQDISRALTNFALDLETQLPGLQLVHAVDVRERLERFLPRVTEALEQNSILIAIDNIESLLSAAGAWRDERWRLLIEALIDHDGLSRVILTSRRLPEPLPARIQVEAIHALSLGEAALLARQLPRLGALMAGKGAVSADRGRELVRSVLRVVQGHPKLIELAEGQAADPAALEARLAEADGAWAGGASELSAFFRTGESAEKPDDFLRVLDSWTRGAAAELDDAAKLLFQFLCCLEEEDRLAWVAQSNWGDLWRRLERPGEPPALEPTLAVVVERGLVDVVDRVDTVATGEPTKASAEQQALRTRYRIHPGVAEAARRDVAPGFQEAVDRELAAFWSVGIGQGVDRDDGAEVGPLVIRAGLGVVPYLLRLGDWSYARTCIEQVIGRDLSPGTLSVVLPYLRHIAEAARGTPHELKALGTLAKSLAPIDAEAAEATYRAVLERALAAQELWTASVVAGELVELLRKRGRLEDALEMVEREMEYTRRSGQGPWSQLMDECQRLKILTDMGRHEEALAEARRLRQVMAGLPEKSDDPEALKPWKVREAIAIVAQKAALSLKRWEEALAINAETIASREARGATRLQITHALFSNYSALLRLKRYDECRLLLKYCRDVFEAEHDMAGLAAAFTALADLEDESGHHAEAAAFEERSLRYEYALGHPASIAVSHSNLALYSLRSGADSPRSVLHLLATAVIRLHFEDGQLASTIRSLAGQLATNPPVPESFAALADQLEQTEGVRFRELMRRVIPDAAAGDAALVEVLRRARSLPAEETLDLQPYLDKWQPMVPPSRPLHSATPPRSRRRSRCSISSRRRTTGPR